MAITKKKSVKSRFPVNFKIDDVAHGKMLANAKRHTQGNITAWLSHAAVHCPAPVKPIAVKYARKAPGTKTAATRKSKAPAKAKAGKGKRKVKKA